MVDGQETRLTILGLRRVSHLNVTGTTVLLKRPHFASDHDDEGINTVTKPLDYCTLVGTCSLGYSDKQLAVRVSCKFDLFPWAALTWPGLLRVMWLLGHISCQIVLGKVLQSAPLAYEGQDRLL